MTIGMKHEVIIRDTSDLRRAAEEFLRKIGNNRIIAFFAPMGAGKTTFTTAICSCLGVQDPVCSPTFTIINEYRTDSGEPVYHFDFYRITRLSEAIDIGLYDYLGMMTAPRRTDYRGAVRQNHHTDTEVK